MTKTPEYSSYGRGEEFLKGLLKALDHENAKRTLASLKKQMDEDRK
jgi:hypothetical protein